MKTKKFIKDSQGFTLVELMVVVGIIGILATIAIPNFRKYQAKSKTTEAKIQLSSVYTTMESLLLEYDTYATCLSVAGYNPSPDYSGRFYAVGFDDKDAGTETAASNNGLASCTGSTECTGDSCTASHYFFQAEKSAAGFTGGSGSTGNKIEDGDILAAASLTATNVGATTSTFQAVAGGAISGGGTVDTWSMDQTKKMSHAQVGY